MNKKKIIQIGIIIFVIVFVAICIAIVQFSKKDLEEAKKGLEETQKKYGWVEKENINLENSNTQVTYEKQKSFLETNLGQIINGGVDLGLRVILPDIIEDEIIEIKDSIITDGFKAGVKTAIDNAVDMGKSFLGIFTGNFENMSQIREAIKKGGLIDSISDVLDWGINKAKDKNLINKNSVVSGSFDEDLQQEIKLLIFKVLSKNRKK